MATVIQSSNIKVYQKALDQLEKGKLIHIALKEQTAQWLIRYKTYETQGHFNALVIGGYVAALYEPKRNPSDINFEVRNAYVQPGDQLTMGPSEELIQLFAKNFKAATDKQTAEKLQLLEERI